MKTCPQCGSEYELDVMFCPRDGSTLRVPVGGGLEGSIIADRYHILRKLGEGGMGQVYLAEHIKMGRKSAIKVMNPSMSQDPDAIGRFNREAANASRISNNNVAAIYDFGETPEGLIYLAMEYVEGEPLTKVMEKTGALPADRAANITRQVAEALNAAHEIGIVHRDLKPDNIMIAKNRDGSDMVKVVDFGIAKAQGGDGQKVTKTGLVVGTPEYMSPEQLSGDALDGRSDIYTLALVTFHMLTGTLPFPSTTLQESMIMRLTDRPRTLAEMRPDASWPGPLQAVLDRALQRKAEDRYQHATDFSSDLTRAVTAMPPGSTVVGVAPAAAAGTGAGTGATGAAATGGAMPSTAVRNAAGTGTRAPAMPNTTPTAAPVTAPAAPAVAVAAPGAARGSRRGLLVAAGLVIAALGGGAYWYLEVRPGAAASPPPAATVAVHDSTPASTAPAGGSVAPPPAAPRDSAPATDSTLAQAPNGTADSAASPKVQEFAKPGASAPPTTPPKPKDTRRARERRAAQSAASGSQASAPGPTVQPPTSTQPSTTPPAGAGGAGAGSPNAPAASPPASPSTPPSDDEFAGSLSAARAQAAVNRAAELIKNKEPDRALAILSRALKALPTGNDSVTAFYHVSEALLERAEMTNNPQPRQRACAILGSLRNARGTTYAGSITFMFNQYCK